MVPICPCGESTGKRGRRYHPECREKYARKKPPLKMITHTCIGCGEDFERPWNYPSKLKYCSNACSHRQVKKVRDKFIADLPEGAVVFHSGWEIRFWAICLRLDIPIRSYDGPAIKTPVGLYRPDFIVPDPHGNETVVDVKGWSERPGTPEKLMSSGVVVIDEVRLKRFEEMRTATNFLSNLRWFAGNQDVILRKDA